MLVVSLRNELREKRPVTVTGNNVLFSGCDVKFGHTHIGDDFLAELKSQAKGVNGTLIQTLNKIPFTASAIA